MVQVLHLPFCSRALKCLGDLSDVSEVEGEGWADVINLKQYDSYFKDRCTMYSGSF